MGNRLAGASSPYLRQHASNPVDWYPWGEEALSAARTADRPILLSVGYSACHWCHVMAHESFEDAEIAALMNRLFVCVKVDREERPDVDAVYMRAVQAITGQGGWPMTVFLTPDGTPFFGGTYFPPRPRHGMPGFPTVLRAAHDAWRNRRSDLERAGAELGRALAAPSLPAPVEPTATVVAEAARRLIEEADHCGGGFGGPPKFPHPAALELLLRRGHLAGDSEAAAVARTSLRAMAAGGIFDQLGGGFHRYSVDARWLVPHFEKMLYDSAQLAALYLHAWQLTGDPEMRRVAEATLGYLIREMRLPDGGFAASQDADSEGEEGRFFVWTPDEVAGALGSDEDARLACAVFGVTEAGSFERGRSVLCRRDAAEDGGDGGTGPEAAERIDGIRRRLLEARRRRVAPGRDAKVVTAWNALAIRALAEAGAAMGRADLVAAARSCAGFLLSAAAADGRLRRSWSEGVAGAPAFLEDVAGLGDALVALYEATGEPRWYAAAISLADEAVERFRDPGGGGYFDTARDAEPLFVRPRSREDNPLPAGTSLAAQLFTRLAGYTGERRWRERALEIVGPLTGAIARAPLALGSLACVADRLVAPSREVAVVGAPDDPGTRALLAEVWRRCDPYRVLAFGPEDGVPLLAGRPAVGSLPTAYVCEGFICRAPTSDPAELARQLDAGRASARP